MLASLIILHVPRPPFHFALLLTLLIEENIRFYTFYPAYVGLYAALLRVIISIVLLKFLWTLGNHVTLLGQLLIGVTFNFRRFLTCVKDAYYDAEDQEAAAESGQ